MQYAITISIGLAFALYGVGLQAQIYESEGPDGQTVFSDVPTTGAEAVDLPDTNTANSVEVRPPEPRQENRAKQPGASGQHQLADEEQPTVIYGNDDNWEEVAAQRRRQELREKASDGEKPTTLPAREREHQTPARRPHVGGRR